MAATMTSRRAVAMMTGASRGIGAEAAARLGRDGFHVLVNVLRGTADAEAVAEGIRKAGGEATILQGDGRPFNTLGEAAARLRHGGRIINLSSGKEEE